MDRDHLVKLSFASIDRLAGGEAASAVNEAIERILADLARHGGDGRTRKLVIEVGVKRSPGQKERFTATVTAKAVLPNEKPKATHGYIEVSAGSAEALFSPVSPANPDQLVLPMEPTPPPEPGGVKKPARSRKREGQP